MKVSIQIPNFTWPGGPGAIGPTLANIARAADAGGVDTIWVMDHFFQLEHMIGPADDPMLEGYTTLSYLAGITERVRLGTLVTGAIYRPPALLLKTVTTLDVLSGGRAWLGLGAGWYEKEAIGLGFGFPSLKERFERLADALELITQGWRDDRSAFTGHHVTASEPIVSPQPLTRPHPPIMIGGGGEQRTLRLVARHADAWNYFAYRGIDEAVAKLAILRRRCDEIGRDEAEISKTLLARVDPANEHATDVIARCQPMVDAGFDHIIFNVVGDHTISAIEMLGRTLIPALNEL